MRSRGWPSGYVQAVPRQARISLQRALRARAAPRRACGRRAAAGPAPEDSRIGRGLRESRSCCSRCADGLTFTKSVPAGLRPWYDVGMPEIDVDDALLIRPSARAQVPTLVSLGLIFGGYLILGAAGVLSPSLAISGVVVFGVVLVIGGAGALRARNSQWELRLDPSGLTVRGHRFVPWTDLTEVRSTGLRPRWLFRFSLGYRVVSFIGKPGVELPALPSTSFKGRFERRSARVRERFYGSRLIVTPYAMDTSADKIANYLHRWSTLPIR